MHRKLGGKLIFRKAETLIRMEAKKKLAKPRVQDFINRFNSPRLGTLHDVTAVAAGSENIRFVRL